VLPKPIYFFFFCLLFTWR